ncbi:MAG: tRNA pseudouridine(38-40) synthase TruA [Candidatus Omnitrophica bacterium]|nr:tRNA pseudouridine(38-40) synthase TruA [Candidatus Omnitrophota bacterium]
MRNIKLTIRYDGTNYAGWQFQKNAVSIQETLQKAIKKVTGRKASVIASGRTDAGVHALAQTANFRTPSKIPLKNLRMALNTILSDDIVIFGAEEVSLKFNAQKDAKSKVYRYTIYNRDFMDPLLRRYAAKCFFKLDEALMRKGAKYLVGRHDFTSFRTKDKEDGSASAVRNVRRIKIARNGDIVRVEIEADGFLYNMVRNIIGTLIEVGRGKYPPQYVKEILVKKDKRSCGPTAPAKGLCLVNVRY